MIKSIYPYVYDLYTLQYTCMSLMIHIDIGIVINDSNSDHNHDIIVYYLQHNHNQYVAYNNIVPCHEHTYILTNNCIICVNWYLCYIAI